MSNILSTYSGRDTNIAITHPLFTPIQAAGIASLGLNQATIRMTQDQASLKVGMDGAVVPSVIPGDQGEIELQVWQTSTLHQLLLAGYNLCKAARDQGDVSNWFAGTIVVVNIVDGSSHHATGVGFKKVPDKTYQTEAQVVTWVFAACNIVSE